MHERILPALEQVRQHLAAACVIVCEMAPNDETTFVVACVPAALLPEGTPFHADETIAMERVTDASRLPVALRLALSPPPTHSWTQLLPGTRLKVMLVWSKAPCAKLTETLASYIDEQLRLPADDFALRRQLSMENARLETVLALLEQAVVSINGLRQEARINRAAEQLLGLSSSTVSARSISSALQRFQAAALNQEAVSDVALTLARQPGATVSGVIWHFANAPTHVRVTTAPLDRAGVSGRIWVFDDISVQMAALDAADEAQAKYRLLAENADDIVFRESANGTLEWMSDSVMGPMGWTAQEMVGRRLEDFVYSDDRDLLLQAAHSLRDTSATNEREVYRARFFRKNGTYRWLEVSIRRIVDDTGMVSALIGSARDVQDEVLTQRALALSQARLRASVDGMLDPQALLAPLRNSRGDIVDFVYLEVNRATTEYLSKSADDLIGNSLLQTMPGLKELDLFAQYVNVMQNDAPLVVNDILYDNEVLGLVRRYDIRATRVGDDLTLTWRDTTERFEAQHRIAQSEQHFRLLAENSADVVTLIRDGFINWVSPSLTRTLDWQPAQWLGQSYLEYLHPDDRALAEESVSAIEASGARVLRMRVRALSGRYHWAEIHADVFIGNDGNPDGLVASFRTIDAEVAAEAALARMARFDTLTGLANRSEALHRFAERQARTRSPGGGSAVLFCDVDRFKSINDTYGHAAGDETLRVLADRMRACVRSNDICARMGGDELLVILDGIHELRQAGEIAEKLREAAERPIRVGDDEVKTSLSIGVALAKPGEEFDQVMSRADTAMYEAKKQGRNQVVLVG